MSYGYADHINLSATEILKRVSQAEIFELVFGFLPVEGDFVTSPFRDDMDANCDFRYYDGRLYFVDFASLHPYTHWDCFRAVQDLFGLDFNKALILIDKKLELGLSTGHPIPVVHQVERLSSFHKGAEFRIEPVSWSKPSSVYWRHYLITEDQLKEDKVVPLAWYSFYSYKKGKWVTVRPQGPAYAYTEFHPKVKIYAPFDERRFMGNCTRNDIGGYNALPPFGKRLFITKSYKDWRTLKNLGLISVWFQSENTIPDDIWLLDLLDRFDEICIFYDNDRAGHHGALELHNHLFMLTGGGVSVRRLHLPVIADITDPSDMVCHFGSYARLRIFLRESL